MSTRPFICIALFLAQAPVLATSADERRALALSANCYTCHGADGRGSGPIPDLAGLRPTDIIERMQGFRDGTRPATIMDRIARGYTPQETARIAAALGRVRTEGLP